MKFIPYEKLSKRQKRALDRARRGDWGALRPVTRRTENPKAYNRAKTKKRLSGDAGEAYFLPEGYRLVTKQSPSNGTAVCAILGA